MNKTRVRKMLLYQEYITFCLKRELGITQENKPMLNAEVVKQIEGLIKQASTAQPNDAVQLSQAALNCANALVLLSQAALNIARK